MINKSKFLEFAIKIAKQAGSIQNKYFGNITDVSSKSTSIDLVTEADKQSELFIIEAIKEKFPNHSILSEESGLFENKDEYIWVVDPLDGTTNFTHNLPIFAVSIALVKNSKAVSAVVYNPAADKCFYAEIDKGAYLNSKKIKCTSSKTLSKSLIATGFPYLHDEKYDRSFEIFKNIYDKTRGVRRLGCASLDLCFVAMGRFDGYYEFNLKPWDICAGSLIASESNAEVTDWDGKTTPSDGSRILATNGFIHNEMIDILSNQKFKIFFN